MKPMKMQAVGGVVGVAEQHADALPLAGPERRPGDLAIQGPGLEQHLATEGNGDAAGFHLKDPHRLPVLLNHPSPHEAAQGSLGIEGQLRVMATHGMGFSSQRQQTGDAEAEVPLIATGDG